YSKLKGLEKKIEESLTESCPWCNSSIPKDAVRCKFCTSIVNEKVPPQYKRDGTGTSNNDNLIAFNE
ncbi:8482_t:CDS:1, partial [Acaulospora morrowiae]